MSGGSYNYAFDRVEEMADRMQSRGDLTPLRLAFCEHLRLVAAAMRAVEWVDSSDWGKGDENDPIRVVLGSAASQLELSAAVAMAEKSRVELEAAIEAAKAKGKAA